MHIPPVGRWNVDAGSGSGIVRTRTKDVGMEQPEETNKMNGMEMGRGEDGAGGKGM